MTSFNLKEIVNGQPTMSAERTKKRSTDEFKRGVMTANLHIAQQQQDKREQELTLREALLQKQATELSGLQLAVEQQSAGVGGILGQVMGSQAPQSGMPPQGSPPQGMSPQGAPPQGMQQEGEMPPEMMQ